MAPKWPMGWWEKRKHTPAASGREINVGWGTWEIKIELGTGDFWLSQGSLDWFRKAPGNVNVQR